MERMWLYLLMKFGMILEIGGIPVSVIEARNIFLSIIQKVNNVVFELTKLIDKNYKFLFINI